MLINLRNALMSDKRLPYNAEVEYLESTGAQWIDTGYVPNANSDIRLSVQFTSTATQQMGVGRQSSSQWALLCGFHNSKVCAWVNVQQNTSILASSTDRIDIFFNCATGAYGGGSTTFSGLVPPNEQVPTFGLFARNNGDNRSAFCSCRFFSFKVYENGVLVRDFIPVRKGTVGYLYDRVSGKLFGNAGTGDFVLGPDVVPVEYIESHGTEWIDTGCNADSNLSVEITMAATASTSWSNVNPMGAILPEPILRHHLNFGNPASANGVNYYFGPGSTITRSNYKPVNGVPFTVKVDATSKTFSVASFTGALSSASFDTGLSYWLFARNSTGTVQTNSIRGYAAKLWYGTAPARSLLPVRVGTEGAMMDVLTRRIYRNAGTGAFTYGNDLKYPIPAS